VTDFLIEVTVTENPPPTVLVDVIEDVPEVIEVSISNLRGEAGLSAYQIAVNNGFLGTESEWNIALYGSKRILHDWETPYSYTGKALPGTETNEPNWVITRMQVTPGGVISLTQAVNVAWDDRLTEVYS
jgi:hypothetical protein